MLKKKGEATLGEIMLIVVLVGVIMFGQYEERKKATESDSFTGQSQDVHPTSTTNRYSLFDLVFSPFNWQGCATIPKKNPPETYKVIPVSLNSQEEPATAPVVKEDNGW